MRRLYYSQNSNPRLALSVARFLGFGERPGLEMEFEAASPFEPAHTPFFKALNPNIQIPILVEDGEPLWEADAIACRLIRVAQSPLWPLDERLPDLVRWLSWCAQHLNRHGGEIYFERLVRPTFSDAEMPAEVMRRHETEFAKYLRVADDWLRDRQWILGNELSYADFRLGTFLPYATRARMNLEAFPEVRRLGEQLARLPHWCDPYQGLDE